MMELPFGVYCLFCGEELERNDPTLCQLSVGCKSSPDTGAVFQAHGACLERVSAPVMKAHVAKIR
jgi:hypothetical protein